MNKIKFAKKHVRNSVHMLSDSVPIHSAGEEATVSDELERI
jgi:hypothetical protein